MGKAQVPDGRFVPRNVNKPNAAEMVSKEHIHSQTTITTTTTIIIIIVTIIMMIIKTIVVILINVITIRITIKKQ